MITTEEAAVDASPLQRRESIDSARVAVHTDPERNALLVLEKPSEDGYNWRKYGQKNVKGNQLIRSYYKCSYHNCLVKKQVERAHDGRIKDTTYFGKHDHPKPQTGLAAPVPSVLSVKVQTVDTCHSLVTDAKKEISEPSAVTDSVEGTCDATSPSSTTKDANNDNNQVSKRRKKGVDDVISMDDKPSSEPRRVVETVSAVDIVNDGYRWRKYGQKVVKDNPNARSYYRCSHPGCPAKKRVERASHDPKVVISSYEGHHDHAVAPVRNSLNLCDSRAARITSDRNGVNSKAIIVYQAPSGALISKQEKGNNFDRPAGIDEPLEGNGTGAGSYAAASKEEQGNKADHPVGNLDPLEVDPAGAAASKEEQGITTDHPAETDKPSVSGICKREQSNSTDLPSEKDQAQSRSAICKQDLQDPVEKDELGEAGLEYEMGS